MFAENVRTLPCSFDVIAFGPRFRASNNDILDNYQLQSLDGLFEADFSKIALRRTNTGKLTVDVFGVRGQPWSNRDTFSDVKRRVRNEFHNSSVASEARREYDVVIRCLGFTYDDSMFSS